jgi:hypothetical protein
MTGGQGLRNGEDQTAKEEEELHPQNRPSGRLTAK